MHYLSVIKSKLENLKAFHTRLPSNPFILKIIIFYENLNKKSEKLLNKLGFLDKYFNYFFVIFIIIFYIIFKIYFKYGMGWDDGRFYIFYPTQTYNNMSEEKRYAPLEIENNTFYYTNTMFFLSQLEKVGFEYKDIYFLIFFLGFYFCYLCLTEIKSYYNFKAPLSKYFIFFLSLAYTCNPNILDFLWNNHYIGIFSIVAVPVIYLFLLKLVFNSLRLIDILIFNLLLTGLSIFFALVVHVLVVLILSATISIIYIIFNYKNLKYFFLNSILFISLFLLTNYYWIYHFFINSIATTTFIGREHLYLEGLRGHLNHYYSFNNLGFLFLYGSYPSGFNNFISNLTMLFFSLVILISVIKVVYVLIKNLFKNKKINDYFLVISIFCILVIGYLQSISLTRLGISLYLLLAEYIFPLNSLANYVNKVPPVYTLTLFTIILLAYKLFERNGKFLKLIFIVFTLFFAITSLTNLIFLNFKQSNLDKEYFWMSTFSEDVYELSKFLKENSKSNRIAYFPMSEGDFVILKNESKKELFVGCSPFRCLYGIDDIKDIGLLNFITGNFQNNSDIENFYNLPPEKILFKLKFLGADHLVINNTIDLKERGYVTYPQTLRYQELYSYIKDKLHLVYKTKNNEFSVYKFPNEIIQFKKTLYSIENMKDFDFYSLNYDKESFTTESIPRNNFTYISSYLKEPGVIIDSKLDFYKDKFGNSTRMIKAEISEPLVELETGTFIYKINANRNNVLRIINENKNNSYSIDVRVDNKEFGCIEKVFDLKEPKNISCQKIDQKIIQNFEDSIVFTYTTQITSPQSFYVKVTNNSNQKIYNFDPKFYLGFSDERKNINLDTEENRIKYLNNYFEKNILGTEYQIPINIDYKKINRDSYEVKLKLNDNRLPIILVLKNYYNNKWEISGEGIQKQIKFKSDSIFNGWIIYPKRNELSITVSFQEEKKVLVFKEIGKISIYVCIVFLICYYLFIFSKKLKVRFKKDKILK